MAAPLPLNALKAFEVAARHLSFSRAANELNVTPAAVSQSIKTLEEYLGVALFHRAGRGLTLTRAAEAGLPSLRDGFQKVAEGLSHIRSADSKGVLTVWVAPSFASKWLVPRLHGFTQANPEVSVRVSAVNELIDLDDGAGLPSSDLRKNNIDFAIRFGKGHYPDCRVEKLMSATAIPMCSPRLLDHPQHPLRRPEDLRHHTLLHDDTAYGGRPDWPRWLAAADVAGVDGTRGLSFNQVSLALESAADDQGVVLSIAELAVADLQSGRLVIPFNLGLPLENAYYLISSLGASARQQDEAFRQWVLDEAAKLGDELARVRSEAADVDVDVD